jgi:hypothetical protein
MDDTQARARERLERAGERLGDDSMAVHLHPLPEPRGVDEPGEAGPRDAAHRGAPAAALSGPPDVPLAEQIAEEAAYSRHKWLRQIEQQTARRLLVYVAEPGASISARDVPPIVDMLEDVAAGDGLDLLLAVDGGDLEQAERIAVICRKRVGPEGSFRVVVPDAVRGPGTLIALAGDEIVMGEPSELGAIEPSVEIPGPAGISVRRPARALLDGLERIAKEAGEGPLSPAYALLLEKLDPAVLDACERSLEWAERAVERLLRQHMLRDDRQGARVIARALTGGERAPTHAASLDAARAAEMGLRVSALPHDDELWKAYWRMYGLASLALGPGTQRVIEGRLGSIRLP